MSPTQRTSPVTGPRSAWLTYGAFAVFSLAAFVLVQCELTEPYMDEIFHIPQAQQYCRGYFLEWDPKLTTPPGLYLLSLPLHHLTQLACTPALLRLTNLLLVLALPAIITLLLAPAGPASRKPTITVESVAISLFPPLWFFGHLYYTDVGSCVSVLASWAAARSGRAWIASLLGLVSLTFRQTNVVWLGFVMASTVVDALERLPPKSSPAKTTRPRLAREYQNFADFLGSTFRLSHKALADPRRILFPFVLPYFPTFLAFLIFVRWNEGIVLGHKEFHVATIHLPQTLYFFAFATALGWPVLLDLPGGVSSLVRRSLQDAFGGPRQIIITSSLLVVTIWAVKNFTIAHPFLLADNRHYAFYAFRRIINVFPSARYLLAPGYVACGIVWGGRLLRSQTPLTVLGLLAATLITLTPSPLIEPRYFLLPYLVMRILASSSAGTPVDQRRKTKWAWVEIAWHALVNIVTVGVFLRVKFRWESEEGVWQRFMW